jgi:hypothetical protein
MRKGLPERELLGGQLTARQLTIIYKELPGKNFLGIAY